MANARKPSAAGTRPSLRERNRLRTRRELLNAALKVFAENGFAGSAVEAIAAEAGASKVTLYAYFPEGRDDLFREVYEEINVELLAEANAAHAQARGLVDSVVALCRPLLNIGAKPLVGQFYSNSDPTVEPTLAPVRGHVSRVYAKLLELDISQARRSGRMEDGVEPSVLALLLVGAMRAALVAVAIDPSSYERLIAGIVTLADGLLRPGKA